ncbi:MAG: extracellular solute-binding protein [Dactylosporangium sp.]|nr:extracellular solute-binding protein [Dactylosporangium sp.]NNJ61095.1 extracellular solute-binding protein [Dactylosporangium sp.]
MNAIRGSGHRSLRSRALVALAIAVAVVGATAACSPGASGKPPALRLSIFWWGGPERASITEQTLALYTRKHPNITFKRQWQANNGYYHKLATMAAGGQAPDIFQMDDNSLTDYAIRNIARDLSDLVGPGNQIDESRLPESLVAYGNVGGRPFGVPSSENTPALFYDKTLLRELGMPEPQIGWTYRQLIDWAAEITRRSGGKVYGTMDPSADYKALWLWLRSQGKELYDGSSLGFTADDLQRWLDLWASARQRGATPPPEIVATANTNDTDAHLVINQRGATTFAWSNMLAELQKGTDHELGITAFPGNPSGQWARASQYWSIYKGTRQAEEAAKVIDFLVNDLEAGTILGTERGLPANIDIRTHITPGLPPSMRATVAYETAMAPRFGPAPAPPPKGHSQVKALLLQAAESVLWGRTTTRQAAAQLMTRARPALEN